MRVLLVSTYELGHQPLHVASPAAALTEEGHDVRMLDISVEPWDPDLVAWAEALAFSVPMHTATRLATKAAEATKRTRPNLPVCFFGLYARSSEKLSGVDHVIAGEYEPGLVAWVEGLTNGTGSASNGFVRDRQRFNLPVRSGLPALDRYAKLAIGSEERLVGYVEASHGCSHRCRHCPVPVVYDGRTRRVPIDVVLTDVEQLVAQGAEHITIGDPDFLNRWAHSMQVVEELHARFPFLTYDVTTKVEHIIKHRDVLGDLSRTGCLFVVSAFEILNDEILRYLDKGHTAAEAARAITLLRSRGIEPRPSWLPFMPWTTVDDVIDVVDFIVDHDLVGNVDPVQLTIKLLIPEGSLMLSVPELEPYLGSFDHDTLSYEWRPADPATTELQHDLASIVEHAQERGAAGAEIFCDVRDAVYAAAGKVGGERDSILRATGEGRPRLTETWFCCAEPTDLQFSSLEEENGCRATDGKVSLKS
ncbi:MAG: CUAEP/CCAEP-tail radical SAM protein [Actinomycetota bacterium]